MKNSNFDMDNKVVQHNDLMKSLSSMDGVTLKLFEMCVSCLDTSVKDLKSVNIRKSDVFAMFEADDSKKYTRFRDHMRRLQRQIITIYDPESNKVSQHVAIPSIIWGLSDDNDRVIVEFNTYLLPYLLQLKANFTQYEIGNIRKMRSKYAIILYKLAKMHTWKSNSFTLTIEQLREYTDTKKDYLVFADFERRVLRSATSEINGSGADLLISYDKIKPSRKITAIRFEIRRRNSYRDNDYNNPVYIGQPFQDETSVDPAQMELENL
jgi:plasmid replication initiation protein